MRTGLRRRLSLGIMRRSSSAPAVTADARHRERRCALMRGAVHDVRLLLP